MGSAFTHRGSSVGTATGYGAGRSGDRIPARAIFSAPAQTGSGTHPVSYEMVTGLFPGVKRPGHLFDYLPYLVPRLKKEKSYTCTNLCHTFTELSWSSVVLWVRGSNPGEGDIFRTRPDRFWDPPSLLRNGYRIIPGGKAAGAFI
jgi:hypothetical protein